MPLGSELHMGQERCSLRGLDHLQGPTFHSLCGNFLIYPPKEQSLFNQLPNALFPSTDTENGKVQQFLQRWIQNPEQTPCYLTVFPEKRYFRESTSTTEVAIHTNLFTDLYVLIGSGLTRTGGWYTTIMKLPFLFLIRIGFLLAAMGGLRSLVQQQKKKKWSWN